jgi:DNA-binding NarL/FixJ family response regulator
MPGLSGIEVTRRAKPISPKTAILILTAYDNDEYIFALLEAGAAGYLLKDAPAIELVKAVRLVHAGEPVLHPLIAQKVIHRALKGRDEANKDDSVELSRRARSITTGCQRDV